jgi:hypothetical protein
MLLGDNIVLYSSQRALMSVTNEETPFSLDIYIKIRLAVTTLNNYYVKLVIVTHNSQKQAD